MLLANADHIPPSNKQLSVTSTGGNLCGKDSRLPNTIAKRACILSALTWRAQAAILRGDDTKALAKIEPLKVLHEEVDEDEEEGERELKTLGVEFDGRMVVLEYVKPGLMVGVFGDEIAKEEPEGTNGHDEEHGNGTKPSEDDESEYHDETRNEEDDRSEVDVAKDQESNGSTSGSTKDHHSTQESKRKLRVLRLKAFALAEYLAEELKHFTMPEDLE
jgi:hypothetical protein